MLLNGLNLELRDPFLDVGVADERAEDFRYACMTVNVLISNLWATARASISLIDWV